MNDKISVMITTYKRGIDRLSRCVSSVAAQSYEDIELLLVDDNPEGLKLSPQTIQELTRIYGSDLKYLTYEDNRGACFARNYGASRSTGSYLAFLDDDDEWDPAKLEEQINAIKDPDIVMVTCDSELIEEDASGQITNRSISRYTDKTLITLPDMFIEDNSVGGASFPLIKRDAFEQVKGFNEDLKACQDWDLWIRLLKIGNAARIPKPLVKYYWHPGDNISTNWDRKRSGTEYMIQTYSGLASDKRKWISRQYSHLADLAFCLSDNREGFKYSRKALFQKTDRDTVGNLVRNTKIVIAKKIRNLFRKPDR